MDIRQSIQGDPQPARNPLWDVSKPRQAKSVGFSLLKFAGEATNSGVMAVLVAAAIVIGLAFVIGPLNTQQESQAPQPKEEPVVEVEEPKQPEPVLKQPTSQDLNAWRVGEMDEMRRTLYLNMTLGSFRNKFFLFGTPTPDKIEHIHPQKAWEEFKCRYSGAGVVWRYYSFNILDGQMSGYRLNLLWITPPGTRNDHTHLGKTEYERRTYLINWYEQSPSQLLRDWVNKNSP